VQLLGAPVQDGAGRLGCEMGPSALRTAGLVEAIAGLGHSVTDLGTVTPRGPRPLVHDNVVLEALPEVSAWTEALAEAAYAASDGAMPIFLGGDHSLSAGTLAGIARRAAERAGPLFVLWLDAHPDFHTLETTESGHLHGTPVAYAVGRPGFEGYFPELSATVDPTRSACSAFAAWTRPSGRGCGPRVCRARHAGDRRARHRGTARGPFSSGSRPRTVSCMSASTSISSTPASPLRSAPRCRVVPPSARRIW
jgi:arginase family enzyme